MKQLPYIDLHTHTLNSDGALTPEELVAAARDAGIGTLAITDHNFIMDLTALRAANPDMTLIQGCEVSCMYRVDDSREVELHVVALDFDPEDPAMRQLITRNRLDRRPYIDAILEKLAVHGIHVGTYEDVRRRHPDTKYLGRMAIARDMVSMGYVKDIDQAFDVYLGGCAGQHHLAYVPSPLRFVSLEEAIPAIRRTGTAILAHLYYYNLSDAENERLLATFKALGGDAMETEYGAYTRPQRDALARLAEKYGLLPSAGSDFHTHEGFSLEQHFPHQILDRLMDR